MALELELTTPTRLVVSAEADEVVEPGDSEATQEMSAGESS